MKEVVLNSIHCIVILVVIDIVKNFYFRNISLFSLENFISVNFKEEVLVV